MTLSGNLGFVPLDEVLRLLTRAGNTGVVEIDNGNVSGRIFVAGQGVGLATTFTDSDLRRHLVNSGYVSTDTDGYGRVDFSDELLALIREMTVESIYRMNGAEADFQVVRDASSPYSAPTPFDLERVLDDSRKRAQQWDEVGRMVPDLSAEIKINRDLTKDTVELTRESWRLLSEIGSGASVRDLASRLGTTEFAVASVAASMVGDDLLTVEGAAVSHEATTDEPEYASTPEPETAEKEESSIDPDRSWWDEPEADEPAAEELAPATLESTHEGGTGDQSGETSEDTDAFLEKVFSEVGGDTPEDDGHGLMRRRRMGSILRELGED